MIRISFTGDLLAYKNCIRKSLNGHNYDFSDVFVNIKHILQESDFVIGNLETPLAGQEYGFTEMDMLFNTPDAFALNAKNAGFSMFTTANNHCLDKGIQGLFRTIDTLDKYGILHTGTFKSPDDRRFLIKQICGIKIGIISFTYGTNPNVNGIALDNYNQFVVNITHEQGKAYKRHPLKQLILNLFYKLPLSIQNKIHPLYPNAAIDDCVDIAESIDLSQNDHIKKMKSIIASAKNDVDILCFCLHAGGQFNSKIGTYTQKLVNEIIGTGVDVLITNHPHCVLRAECKNNKFIAYSLGNFSFTPYEGYFVDGVYSEYGIILNFDINEKDKQISKITFNVIKNMRLDDGRYTVISTYDLYKKLTSDYERNKLVYDNQAVISRFVGRDINIEIQKEYNYSDL